MSRVEKIEDQIKELSPNELTALRVWFARFDADAWDRQMEADGNTGRLETVADGRFAIMRPAGPLSCESLCVPGLLGRLPGAARIRTNHRG
jgi:hypothetical protein